MELTTSPSYEIRADQCEFIERDDENLASAWFAERNGDVRYVTLCRSLDNNQLYVERDDQAWSAYNGVERIDMTGSRLIVLLNAQAAQQLGNVSQLIIDCDQIDDSKVTQLRSLLPHLVAGTSATLTVR